jgi:hypothetical protein
MPDTKERNLSTAVEFLYLKGPGVTGMRCEKRKKKQFVFLDIYPFLQRLVSQFLYVRPGIAR